MSRSLARLRLRLAATLRRRLLGPVVGRLPQAVMRSVAEHSLRPSLAAHLAAVGPGEEASLEHYGFPADYPPAFRRDKAFDPLPMLTLHDVCVSPSSGLVWLPGGELLQESVGSLNSLLMHPVWQEELLGPVTVLGAGPPVIVHPTAAYYHWLLEILPNTLHLLRAWPGARVLTQSRPPRFVTDGLAHVLGQATDQVVRAEGPVRVSQLQLRPREEFSGFVRTADRQILRAAFQDVLDSAAPDASGALYISRAHTPRRAVCNEPALEQALAARGVTVIYAEQLGLTEQVRLFAGATAVVALHGAGLANLVWCRPGTRVLEVFPEGVFNDCYARLAFSQQLDYTYLRLESPEVPVNAVVTAVHDWIEPRSRLPAD
ncbi:glycosyltransferase family 61 protein [Deinococcus koreensis]|uniref:Glycosyltransferase 61 catalytic domain-containing protein n=1 Tax=Deinococcus koreensis TaxID=2054903 RepID=A0A2K3USB0_9DEIO|nr:glycosyltransferase family 61 protein [Deinococcus koreensis]PNY79425.1 hypothetical protein CVO96_18460 [Deinococcus koreensis]